MNVFRRFTVDRAKMIEFYGDVLGLKPLPPIGMPGGNQMSRFQVGTSEIKLTGAAPGRQDKSGAVREVTGLRVFTFFFPDEAALDRAVQGARLSGARIQDPRGRHARRHGPRPDGQWVELVVVAPARRRRHSIGSKSGSPSQTSRRAARSTASSSASRN